MNIDTYHLWTAVATPFFPDGSIDFPSLENLVIDQERAGNGIMLLGSTGEAISLSLEEREMVAAFVAHLKLSVPVVVGVPGAHLQEVLGWIRYCEGLPLFGYQMLTPIYTRPGRYGQTAWFQALLNETSRPCMLYNVPHRTGCQLSLDTVLDLLEYPHLWAIKEASGSDAVLRALLEKAPRLKLFSGCDDLIAHQISLGAYGVVSVMSNGWPEATQRFVKECYDKKIEGETALWKEAAQAANINNPVSVKLLLHLQGKIAYPKVRTPLDVRDVPGVEALVEADRKVAEWWAEVVLEKELV